MSKRANNLIESENGKLMPPEELFIYNEEQNLQSEIDDLEEGKLFALNTLRQEENIESEKLNYVLDKLSAAGIEVVTDKVEFNSILESQKVLQKMIVDVDEFENISKEIQKLKNYNKNLEVDNKSLVREQDFIDFQTSLIACKKFINDLPGQKLPDLIFNTKNDKGQDINFIYIVKLQNSELVLTTPSNTLLYNFETKSIESKFAFEKFKDATTENDYCEILVNSINKHLGEELGKQRRRFKQLMEENAILSGKALDELTEEETKELKEKLKEQEYENIEGILVHKDKKIAVTPDVYITEIQNAKLLVDRNSIVYILPENFAFKQKNEQGKNESYPTPDTLTNDEFVELKTTNKKLGERFGDAVKQSHNVLIRIKNDISVYNAKKRLQEKINNLPKEKGINVKDGMIFLYFEKNAKFISAEIKNGRINILPTLPSLADLTESRPALSNIAQFSDKSSPQSMVQNGNTYGFAYEGKIHLNPDIMNSEVAVHEYTHLWDNYTQKTNPELWEKGKSILKNTSYWYEVKLDPNYADIANNDDLVLSEIHSRICGELADAVLTKIVEKDGVITKNSVIDWNEEVFHYILTEFQIGRKRDDFDFRIDEEKDFTENLMEFLAQPMKDLMQGKIITNNIDNNVIIDEGIESIQSNHGSSETALEKDYEASLSDTYDEDVYDVDNYEYPFILHNELEISSPFSNRSIGTFYVLETDPIDLKSIYPDMDKLNENQKALIEYTKYEDGREIFLLNLYENKNGKYIPQDLNKGLISRYSFSDGLKENIKEYINELEFERKSPLDQYIILEARRVKFYNEENEHGLEYPKKEEERIYNTLTRIDGKELIEKMELQTPNFKEYPKKLLGENYFGDKRCWSYLNDSMYDMLQNIEQKEHIKVMEKQKEYLISSNKTFIDNINNCLPTNKAEKIEKILQNGDIINFEKNCENFCNQIKQNNNSNNNTYSYKRR